MSNLEKQLQFLKSTFPQATAPKVKSGKESFLFSAEKAGTLSVEDIYTIGINGAQQLSEMDSRFGQYLDTLFQKKSTTRNRELQTKQENEELDAQLNHFLLLLGSYFLLKPAHMALEYLIRRYKIQVYNVDAIMTCILPYHGTLLFTRMVQIMNISESKWHFLESIQKTGSSISRDFLVQRCHTDFNILEFVCEMTMKCVIQHQMDHKTMISFYAAMVIQYVDIAAESQLKDVYLKRLFSFVLAGVKSRHLDYQSASFMILTQIASRKSLSTVALDSFLREIASTLNKYTSPDHALLTIVFLCQSQQIGKLNQETYETLVSLEQFTSKIHQFMKTYDLKNFLDAFIASVVEQSFHKKSLTLLEKYSTEIDIHQQIPSIVFKLFHLYSQDQSLESFVKQVLLTLERKYPKQIDEGISLSLNGLNDQEKQLVLQFTRLTFRGTQHEIVEQVNTSLFLCLEHSDVNIRMLALNKLKDIVASGDSLSEQTKEFIASSLAMKLADDEEAVLDIVLSFPNLLTVIDTAKFIPALAKRFMTMDKESKLKSKVLHVLMQESIVKNDQLLDFVLPVVFANLFTAEGVSFDVLAILSKSKHPLIRSLSVTKGTTMDMRYQVVDAVSKNIAGHMDETIPYCVNMFAQEGARVFLLLVLNFALASHVKNEAAKYRISNTILSLIKTEKIADAVLHLDMLQKSSLNGDALTLSDLCLFSYYNIIQKLPEKKVDMSSLPAFARSEIVSTNHTFMVIELFALMAGNTHFAPFTKHIDALFSRFVGDHAVWFLSLFWSSNISSFTELVQIRALQIAYVFLSASPSSNYQNLIPSLLVCLSNNPQSIKQYALKCIDALINTRSATVKINPLLNVPSKSQGEQLSQFLKAVSENRKQILINNRALSDLFQLNFNTVANFVAESAMGSALDHPKAVLLSLIQNVKEDKLVDRVVNFGSKIVETLGSTVSPNIVGQLSALSSVVKVNAGRVFTTTSGVKLVHELLSKYEKLFVEGSSEFMIPALLITSAITEQTFTLLGEEGKQSLLRKVASVLLTTGQPDVTAALQEAIKPLPASSTHLIALIPRVDHLVLSNDQSMDLDEDHSDTIDELVNVLEIIQIMSQVSNKQALIEPLFNILSVFENENLDIELEKIDYATNMIFSTLRTIIESFGAMDEAIKKQVQSKFNIEMVIRALQSNKSSRIKSHAIMLIGELARVFPVDILTHIVTVIRTMEHAIRQKDNVTFQVIQNTVLQIVPEVLLMGSSPDTIISIFVKCFDYIPGEKRMEFYSNLIKVVSRKKLFVFIAMLLLKNAESANVQDEENYGSDILTFAHAFTEYFKIPKQLICLLSLSKIALNIATDSSVQQSGFDLSQLSAEQINNLLEEIVTFISTHFASVEFLKNLIAYEQDDSTHVCQKHLTTLTETLVLSCCKYGEKQTANIVASYTRIQQLLHGDSFIRLINNLLKNSESNVREKALEIFNAQLADLTPQANRLVRSSQDLFIGMIPALVKIISSQDEIMLKQGAIISLELLSRKFAQESSEPLVNCLPVVLKQLEDNYNAQISSSCALCLATMIVELGINALEYLPSIVNTLLRILQATFPSENAKNPSKGMQLLQITSLSAIDLLIKKQLNFLSPYISQILSTLLHPVLLQSSIKKVKGKTEEVLTYLAENAQLRHILKPLIKTYDACIMLGDNSVIRLLTLLNTVLVNPDVKATESLYDEVSAFLMRLFDHRRLHDAEDISVVEEHICSLFKSWIMKLSENMFRPMLIQLIEWARESNLDGASQKKRTTGYDEYSDEEEENNGATNINRLIMFYKLINTTLNVLQSIFVPYFSLLLEYCATDLQVLNSADLEVLSGDNNATSGQKRKREQMTASRSDIVIGETEHECIMLIVSALLLCFTHDDDGFMQEQSKFDQIMQPLVDQLQNVGDEDGDAQYLAKYNIRSKAVAKCLGKLATVVPHQTWKTLQYQVLVQTQRTTTPIKCGAIGTLISLYTTVGQEFVSMLPELLPYIAELLEDDDDVVVQETQRLVQKVEETCGEDLSRYMK